MSDLQITLLGPFGLTVRGEPVRIAAEIPRTLVAVLAMSAPNPVPVETISRALWESDPPADVRAGIQTYVSRLRRVLPDLIETQHEGYRLRVGAEAVDALRFLELCDQAAAERGSPQEAATIAAALRLWQGRAFVDVRSAWLDARYEPDLVERQLELVERRVDLDLPTERAASAIAELIGLADAHPFRESLWARLMLALERRARVPEALVAYERIRGRLAAELGVSPGPELQRAHLRLLAADEPVPTSSIPRQLPSDLGRFTGRAEVLARLGKLVSDQDAADQPGMVVTLDGPAGIGKTALAVHWAHQVAHLFPGGQLYLDLRGYGPGEPMDPGVAIETLVRALGGRPDQLPPELDARSALLRTMLAGRRTLILLDNARDARQVRPLIPGSGVLVVVTSRNQLRGLTVRDGAHPFTLDGLDHGESIDLLESFLGDRRTSRDSVAELARLCHGLPLALTIAGERAGRELSDRLTDLVASLGDESAKLDTLQSDDDETTDLRGVLSWSHAALPADAARMLRVLSLNPGSDLGVPGAAALAGVDLATAGRLLDRLVSTSQLRHKRCGRYELHDLLRSYASELSLEKDAPADRAESLRRLLGWQTMSAFQAKAQLQPTTVDIRPDVVGVEPLTFTGEADAHAWFETERHNLVASVRVAFAHRFDYLCWWLALATWAHLYLIGAWDEIVTTHQIGLRAAQRCGDRVGYGQMLSGMGVAYRAAGRTELAVRTQRSALEVLTSAGHAVGAAQALNNLGSALRSRGSLDEALDCFRRAGAMERAREEVSGNVAVCAYQEAVTLTALGRAPEAVPVFDSALALLRSLGHRRGEARVLQALAAANTDLGRCDDAVTCYRTAVEIYADLGDRWYEASLRSQLGGALLRCARPAEAAASWRAALRILDDAGLADSPDLHRADLHAQLRSVEPATTSAVVE